MNVAEQGSFHAAAAVLNIAQSALSRQIQQLESELGAELFIRSTKGVTLSTAGDVLLHEVRQILADTEVARSKTWRAAHGQFGRIRIAYTTRVGEMNYAVAAFAEARSSMPDIDYQLKFVPPDAQPALIAANEIDVGLLYHQHSELADISTREIRRDSIRLLVPAEHELAARTSVMLADLRDYDFAFTPEVASPTYNQLIASCIRGGLTPRITMEAPHEAILVQVVSAGLAIGFCDSGIAQRRSTRRLAIVEVSDLNIPLPTVVMWRTDRESSAIKHFIELLLRHIDARSPATRRGENK